MQKRFNYTPDFDVLKEAIIARDSRKIGAVLRRQPNLARASDALGNNALHWSVITRQLGLIERFVELGTPIDAQRADGQTPVLLAVNGAMDYWYRDTRGRSHPSLRNASVHGREPARPRSELHHLRGGRRRRSGARRSSSCERMPAWPGVSTRRASARCPMRRGKAICTSSACCSNTAPIRIRRRTAAPDGRALFEACCGESPGGRASCCWSTAPIQTPAWIRMGAVSRLARFTTATGRSRCNRLLRRHGAYTPPYAMSVQEMKQAIRDGHEVIRHEEFLGNVMAEARRGAARSLS